jgi:DNA-binding MarR family transcriptional regulator
MVAGPVPSSAPVLTLRQKQVLALVAESGGAGPSVVAKELLVGVSTAYRDLASLEDRGLVVSDDAGRRTVTEQGLAALEGLMAG